MCFWLYVEQTQCHDVGLRRELPPTIFATLYGLSHVEIDSHFGLIRLTDSETGSSGGGKAEVNLRFDRVNCDTMLGGRFCCEVYGPGRPASFLTNRLEQHGEERLGLES